jgi:hypothetical protein
MHLLTVDEDIGGGRQRGEGAASYGYAIISGGLQKVDWEVRGAKARCLEPFQSS